MLVRCMGGIQLAALGAVYTYEFAYELVYESPNDLVRIRFPVRNASMPILNWTRFYLLGNIIFPFL
jgi:hypothetical protein